MFFLALGWTALAGYDRCGGVNVQTGCVMLLNGQNEKYWKASWGNNKRGLWGCWSCVKTYIYFRICKREKVYGNSDDQKLLHTSVQTDNWYAMNT